MLTRVSERCYSLPFSCTADRPALGYVRGDRFSLQVDAGNSPAHFALMAEELRAEGLPQPGLITLTHSHWDHSYGMCAAQVPVICCDKTQVHLTAMSRWTWTPEDMQARLDRREDILFCHREILVEYPDLSAIRVRPADIVFTGSMTLDLGGVHVVLLHTENSHADDCVAVFVPEERVVFLGDMCYKDLHHEPVCWHRARFEALVRTLSALDFDKAVMGHQEVLTRAELMQELAESLVEDEDAIVID